VERSKADFIEICEEKSAELLDRNKKELAGDEQHAKSAQGK
jgi:hypothetical protein